MRKLGPLLAAMIIVLIAYAFISVTASAPMSIGQRGGSSLGSGLPEVTIQPKLEIKPVGCVIPSKLTTDGANYIPDVSENYVVYQFNTYNAPCNCTFRANIAPGSCSKGCAYYGKAGERCNMDSDCKGAGYGGVVPNMADIFAYDMQSKFEFPIAQTNAMEVSPSVYGNKVVYFVEGYRHETSSYDSKTGVTSYRTDHVPGKIMLYDIGTGQRTLIASTNAVRDVMPRIYDDTIVWTDGEKVRIKGTFTINKTIPVDLDVTGVGNPEVWSYNIPLKRATKIVAVPWTVGMWGGSIGNGNAAILTSLSEELVVIKAAVGETAKIGDYTIKLAQGGVILCNKDNECSLPTAIDFPTGVGPESLANPDIYEDKIVYQTNINKNWDIMLYDRSAWRSRPLPSTTSDETWPRVFKSRVIWTEGGTLLYMYDLEKKEIVKMNSAVNTEYHGGDIYGANVVWSGSAGSWDIFRNRTNNPKMFKEQATAAASDDYAPATYGPIIAWESGGNIYKYQCPEDIVPALPKCTYKTQGVGFNKIDYPALTFSGQTADSATFTAIVPLECMGRLVQLKKDSCKGAVVDECVVGPYPLSQCKSSFKPPAVAGTYKYMLCDPREGQASTTATLKVA